MNIIQVQNSYRSVGGENVVLESTVDLLKRNGMIVSLLIRNSKDIGDSIWKKMHAFINGKG